MSIAARAYDASLSTQWGSDNRSIPAAKDKLHQHIPVHIVHRLRLLFVCRLFPASMVALLLLVIGLVVFRIAYDDRLYPAIIVGDVAVGGLTTDEAYGRLAERAALLEHDTVSFSYGGQTWTPTLTELGVTVRLEQSIEQAQRMGRGGTSTTRLAFVGDILNADQVIPLQTQLDHRILNAWFDSVDRDIGRLPVNAQISIEKNGFSVSPGIEGEGVDREAATTHIVRALSTLQPVTAELPITVLQPDVSANELESVEADIRQLLGQPIPVTFEDQEWTIDGEVLAPFLRVETVLESGEPAARLSVDTEGLSGKLRTQFSPLVQRTPVNALLGWNDGLVVVEPGKTGVVLKSTAFAKAVSQSFLNGHTRVTVPVVSLEPKINGENLDAYGITTLLGQGDSNFEGGVWERDENVRIGTKYVNGTMVPPGGTFSFNGAVGAITYDKGYKDALVAGSELVGLDVGGGICQVSTTVFRAAIYAGLPIMEWYPHTSRLPNYERDGWGPGFDASILQEGPNPEEWPDFKFKNDTDSWLLIEATVSGYHNYVNIYGSNTGRTVDTSVWSMGDNAFAMSRMVLDSQGNVVEERVFESHFK